MANATLWYMLKRQKGLLKAERFGFQENDNSNIKTMFGVGTASLPSSQPRVLGGRKTMKRLTILALTITFLLNLGAVLFVDDAFAQSSKEQIIGAWTLVSADSVRPDGSRAPVFGPNPKGIMIFSRDGYFALVQMRAELPGIAAKSRDQGTPEENKAIVQGSIAYFGTYSVNEADKVITIKLGGSTFANLLGGGEQKKIITSLTAEELKFINPRTPSGATLEVDWKRAK